ncbi:hypothetical protein DFH07DRAFT_241076 [Mycena maculata]|uniref:F-box domain-containing protein n=1 Tax=Mycena maculata TaxID=230809 RepID=A0AAD7JSR6_9AGAR|nr:hypothetical protein DFH07DRAFT_241076 [Mycena maculata]
MADITLPPEILALIFERCIPTEIQVPFTRASKNIAPLLLGRISRTWRDISLSTPSLWCSLRLTLDRSDARLALLQAWLARSGCLPLTLELVYFHRNDGLPPDALVDILRPHAHQFKVLRLRLPGADIVRLAQWPLPLLQDLDFRWTVGTQPPEALPLTGLFARAPALRKFTIAGGMLPAVLSHDVFPWAQLTQITCSGYSAKQCLDILQVASSLERCAFSGQYHTHHEQSIEPLPPHTNLRSLSFTHGWDDLEILCQAHLPELQELQFTVQPYSELQLISIVPQHASIVKLDLSYMLFNATPLIEYLRSLSSLVDLRVHQMCRPVLVEFFMTLASDPQFLLKLEFLHVECDDDRDLYPSLLKMLSEGRAFRRLKSVSVELHVSIDTPDKQGRSLMAALTQEGMDINFTAGYTYGNSGWMSILRAG